MIKVANVSKQFGQTTAVDNISFDVAEGENLILLGTSGCGKTTTLKMINRLIPPSQGTISVQGKNIMEQSTEQLRRGIGYVLQHNSLFPHYTIAENIAVVPNLLKWDKQKIQARTSELVEKLHLSSEYLSAYPASLSGGQQQRVNIARALAANPPILLMDEPFGALDTITRAAIRKEFSELDELKKKTILMVTHDVQEAFELGDRICLMDKGRIMQLGTPADLLFRPANDFVKNFLSEAYLQLAFKTTKLNVILDKINSVTANNTEAIIDVSTNDTLWQILEKVTADKNVDKTLIAAGDAQSNQRKFMRWDDLLLAFNQYTN